MAEKKQERHLEPVNKDGRSDFSLSKAFMKALSDTKTQQALFFLEFDFQDRLSLTDPQISWKTQTANAGSEIIRFVNSTNFNKSHDEFIDDLLLDLHRKGIIRDNEDLYFRFFQRHLIVKTNIANATPVEFSTSRSFIRRNYLTAIAAIQWHLQRTRIQEYPQWDGQRGGTTLDHRGISLFYLKYMTFENNIEIEDFSRNIADIYTEVKAKMKDSNWFAYLRTNASSHLGQKDLKNMVRFGIDMRFFENGNSLPILPNKGTHLHIGFFQFANGETRAFFKEEAKGFATPADKIAHAGHYIHHKATLKEYRGPRETATPKEQIKAMIIDLKNAGYDNTKMLKKLRKSDSSIISLNKILTELLADISEPDHRVIVKEYFKTPNIIGQEYSLDEAKVSRTDLKRFPPTPANEKLNRFKDLETVQLPKQSRRFFFRPK